jgi:hypothetical protein
LNISQSMTHREKTILSDLSVSFPPYPQCLRGESLRKS